MIDAVEAPSRTDDVTRLGAAELAARVARGAVSVADVIEAYIARMERVNPALNALVVPLFEPARQEARAADALPPDRRGPLHGVPVTVKESFDVAGTATTGGIVARATHRAVEDAPLVARLRETGAIVLGKTNVAQLLFYVETDNPLYGRTNNPWNLERSPGGSSGGEAALLAAGATALGLGTDLGGSARVPAHFSGVCGLKPTPGRLTLAGSIDQLLLPGNEAFADTAGLLARSVPDLRLALDVLARPVSPAVDPTIVPVPLGDPGAIALRGLRVGVYEEDGYFPASAACRRAVREAAGVLESLGVRVKTFRPPAAEGLDLVWGLLAPDALDALLDLLEGGPRDKRIASLAQLNRLPNALRPLVARLFRMQGQHRVAALLPTAGRRTARQYLDLIEARRRYRVRFAALLDGAGIDALLCPPCATPAVTHGATEPLGAASATYTILYNLLAYPAGVVPVTRVRPDEETGRAKSRDRVDEAARHVDLGSAGLPVGVQVAARPWREDVVLALMGAIEAACRTKADYPSQPPL